MFFKSKKVYSLIFAPVVLLTIIFSLCSEVSAKIKCDCIFSVGPACRPAQWLRTTHKRFQSSPFDWMMSYSLDTVNHCLKTKFSDFFEDAVCVGGNAGEHRIVKDRRNGIVSMHHFSKYTSLENAKWDVRNKMIRRGQKVDKILKNSRSIVLICNRQRDSFDDFKRFIHNFSKLYPDRDVTLINIRSNGNNWVSSSQIYESFAAATKKKPKKIKKKKPKPDKKVQAEKQAQEEKQDQKPENQDQKEETAKAEKKINSEKKVKPKKKKKKIRRKLKIIQYSFNDSSPSWEGNAYFWRQVMNDIELSDKNFNRNMDFKTVEF